MFCVKRDSRFNGLIIIRRVQTAGRILPAIEVEKSLEENTVNFGLVILSAVSAYLIGSISFARLVTRWWTSGKDVTEHEIAVDGTDDRYKVLSIGGNSVGSMLGPRAGLTVGVLDILKVFLPTLFFKLYLPEQPAYALAAAVSGMIGHIWPVYYRFHGGSGFSAIMGGLLAIDWLAVLVTPLAGLLLGMLVFRNIVVATLSWIWLLIPWLWWRTDGSPAHIAYAVIINILFLLAMIPEYQTAMKYKQEGKYLEYGVGSLKSHPMGRGMLRIAKFFHVVVK
jgi:acyl-phosphate glycerol 3-phosphate acyltransferase